MYYHSPLHILVAEDDPVTRRLLERTLEKWGYNVTSVTHGEEAWNILKSKDPPRIALLDWLMPKMEGVEIIRRVREIPSERYIYTILLTCRDTKEDLVEGMTAGADDYLTKPFDSQELHVRLRAATRIVKQQEELADTRNQERRIAGHIQKTLLFGRVVEEYDWCTNAVVAQPALYVGGDFYDFFRHNENCYDVVIGDVMGKGIPAALLGAGVKSRLLHTINSLLTSHHDRHFPTPAEIIDYIHAEITPELINLESFITLCYARFDNNSRTVTMVDCGHLPTFHCHTGTDTISEIKSHDTPLGFLEAEKYEQLQIPLKKNDTIFFYSDGITDARGKHDGIFGKKRLRSVVKSHLHDPPHRMLEAVVEKLGEFTDGEMSDDDITAIAIRMR